VLILFVDPFQESGFSSLSRTFSRSTSPLLSLAYRKWLMRPPLDSSIISERLDAVGFFSDPAQLSLCHELCTYLKKGKVRSDSISSAAISVGLLGSHNRGCETEKPKILCERHPIGPRGKEDQPLAFSFLCVPIRVLELLSSLPTRLQTINTQISE
jgi:hypothetical protein